MLEFETDFFDPGSLDQYYTELMQLNNQRTVDKNIFSD